MNGRLASLVRAGARSPALVVAFAFLTSRLVYRLFFEVSLDASPVYYYLQFLDPYFLKTDLVRSVLALHHQAPLLNLFVGICLKLFGDGGFVVIDTAFVALGLAASLALVDVLSRLGVDRWTATLGACCYVCSPVTVLYESWLFYPSVVASLHVCSAWLLLRFVQRQTVASGAAFFAAMATVALVRSTFGLLWFFAVVGGLFALRPVKARTLLAAAAVPLLVLSLHAAKTRLYVGHGYGDAMLWPNLAKKIYVELPRKEARRLSKTGKLSKAMQYEAMSDLDSMVDVRVPHGPTGIPALDDAHAPSGRANANAIEHALIAERYYKPDALFLLKRYPGAYVGSVLHAVALGVPCSPTHDSGLMRSPNYARLAPLEAPLSVAALTFKSGFSPVIAALLLFGLSTGVILLVGQRARLSSSRSSRAFAVFAVLTILYSTAVTVAVSWGDFSRYRFEVDGLFWILIVSGGRATLTRLRHGRRAALDDGGGAGG